jgi:hypothetical protein
MTKHISDKLIRFGLTTIAASAFILPAGAGAVDTQKLAQDSILAVHAPGPVQSEPVNFDLQQAIRDSIVGATTASPADATPATQARVCAPDVRELARASILAVQPALSC